MKKYVKPELFYERFELSQHIADCDWEWHDFDDGLSCYAIADPEFSISEFMFRSDNSACLIDVEVYEGFCYQTGGEGLNTFKS